MNSEVNKPGIEKFGRSGLLILKITLFFFCHVVKEIINCMQQNCNIPSFPCAAMAFS